MISISLNSSAFIQKRKGYSETWGLMERPETVEDFLLKSRKFPTHSSTHKLLGLPGTSKKRPVRDPTLRGPVPLILAPFTFVPVTSHEEQENRQNK